MHDWILPLLLVRRAAGAGGPRTLGYDELTAVAELDPARQFKLGRAYLSVGVSVFPHVLWR